MWVVSRCLFLCLHFLRFEPLTVLLWNHKGLRLRKILALILTHPAFLSSVYFHFLVLRRFPYYYYELNFRIPNTKQTLSIIMLDTVMLCGNTDDFSNAKLQGPLNAVDANRQLIWLQQRMARSKADFLLVAGHYPVWSVSEHGPTECLLKHLRPLLVKHKATAYFCGHDHNLQVCGILDSWQFLVLLLYTFLRGPLLG